MPKNTHYAIGLMSGTSMDGVDAALIQTDGLNRTTFIDSASIAYPLDFHHLLKKTEQTIRALQGQYDHTLRIDGIPLTEIIDTSTQYHIEAAKMLNRTADIIGYHGQTFYHNPRQKTSIILGSPETMAKTLQTPVVFHFRKNDIEHGGVGAPFAPIYHYALAHTHAPCAFINCGGIANVTLIQTQNLDDLSAFDCGPGNGLLDRFIKIKTNNRVMMDEDGQFSLHGAVNQHVLDALWQDSCPGFYVAPCPKALDIQDLILPKACLALSLEDGCATLATFTAHVIATHVKTAKTIFVAGGGFYNPTILTALQAACQNQTIKTADEMNWHLKSLEAQLFAYLAVRHLKNLPLSYPKTTGVPHPLTGGERFEPF
ncbi:MAG: Anhydro-N-acetylmuramic acid kinase [Holosporales bacterium]